MNNNKDLYQEEYILGGLVQIIKKYGSVLRNNIY